MGAIVIIAWLIHRGRRSCTQCQRNGPDLDMLRKQWQGTGLRGTAGPDTTEPTDRPSRVLLCDGSLMFSDVDVGLRVIEEIPRECRCSYVGKGVGQLPVGPTGMPSRIPGGVDVARIGSCFPD